MNVAYLYPWDVVGDPSAPGRLADLGVQTVALAAMYHSTRAATPYHPAHRVLDVPYPAFYLPIRPSSWSRLVPATPTWTPADAYLQARDALKAVGLQVHAWTVLTHNSHLGSAHPDLVVRNAFGDPYPYALCPAHEDVIEYCEHLVQEILEVAEPDGLILEACGPMGFGHQSVHEKTSGADWTPADIDLLSLCFCTSCAPLYPEPTRATVRAAIDATTRTTTTPATAPGRPDTTPPTTMNDVAIATDISGTTPSMPPGASTPSAASRPSPASTPSEAPMSSPASMPSLASNATDSTPLTAAITGTKPATAEDALGPLANEVRAIRVAQSATLRRRLIAVARRTAPNVPITLHANPDPWATGAFAPLPDGEPQADALVANCWGDPITDATRLAHLKNLATRDQRIGAYVLALPPRPADPEVLADQLRTYAKAGATEFHLYHAGLASPHRLAALAKALRLHA
ncbi:unnamed protein product [[Actinomadura] parvosata subsp. kistnae]|uniref:hypothetical protein n=1 Tax=[Actinomadura] parvosata TaxID=1955412 RepID=UPI000D2A546E|nr:hypothetical protein [Nonomuraea sp. ATCC 55076]SPL97222.1 unnamed protein product [Actinomadura parvosata subsp. kistnae]